MSASIFISHSNADDRAAVLDPFVDGLKAAGFTVLYDVGELRAGDQWRDELRRMMYECDAAVILFTRHALDSAWVASETSILMARRAVQGDLLVLPVVIDPVVPADLKQPRLEPSLVSEVEVVLSQGGISELAASVVQECTTRVQPRQRTDELALLERRIVGLLRQADPETLPDAIRALGHTPTAWPPGRPFELARLLLSARLDTLAAAINVLRQDLDRGAIGELLDYVLPVWVDLRAAARVGQAPRRPRGQRAVAVNASDATFTPPMYIARAGLRPVPWPHVGVTQKYGENDTTAFVNELRETILAKKSWGPFTDAQIDQYLVDDERLEPLFVVLQADDRHAVGPLVAQAWQTFSALNFFLVTGPQPSTAERLGLAQVDIVEPPLAPDREAGALGVFTRLRSWQGRGGSGGSSP